MCEEVSQVTNAHDPNIKHGHGTNPCHLKTISRPIVNIKWFRM